MLPNDIKGFVSVVNWFERLHKKCPKGFERLFPKIPSWLEFGLEYGYPECCIRYFVESAVIRYKKSMKKFDDPGGPTSENIEEARPLFFSEIHEKRIHPDDERVMCDKCMNKVMAEVSERKPKRDLACV